MQPTFNFDFSSADNNCDFEKTFYIGFFLTTHLPQLAVREGCGKSKWKFKMAFAMKGEGSRGGLECHLPILKNDFFKNHLESFPDCENVLCT